ncbi:unnamed protein product [Ceutorhynchus assimilis]|uniref:Uncharacterized protein n=1 Tax=Ceutorhynchus assimilis TaxID=467358 RepID=A0A9N9MGW0_9CUCU|nr:unnamed protein product [Ceutorhynchus assimilis]
MIIFSTVLAICCLLGTAKAAPGPWASGSSSKQPLEGTPDFSNIHYPKYDLIDLGEYSKGHVPGDEIKVIKEQKISIPQPYPVKIPVPQPYPVHIEKPYPVHHTKIVKVPVPYPQVIEKKVPYPVEVPKPYPVPVESHHHESAGLEHLGHHALESYDAQEPHGQLPSNEGYEHGVGGGHLNQLEAKLEEHSGLENHGWQPIGGEESHGY